MPLVELVNHDGGHALQVRVGNQAPREYAFGHESQPRAWAARLFKPDVVSDCLANFLVEFPRDSARRHPCCDPAWFKHNHFAVHNTEQRRRDSRRLPRTWSGHDY